MSDDRTVKNVFIRKPDGRRKAGRPKLKRLKLSWEWCDIEECPKMEEESRRHMYGLLFWRRHWLNYKDRMSVRRRLNSSFSWFPWTFSGRTFQSTVRKVLGSIILMLQRTVKLEKPSTTVATKPDAHHQTQLNWSTKLTAVPHSTQIYITC
jgi:hypothetical protein